MNINDIMTQNNTTSSSKGFFKNSMLAIGKKGQTVDGVITGVSNQVSISFNGIEVAVPSNTVHNATEGETRKFKIMDVSKDSIVLKEVYKTDVSKDVQANRSMVSTTVNGSYSYAGNISDNAKACESVNDMNSNLQVVTGEDYEEIQDSEGSFEDFKQSCIERIVKRVKEQKQYQQFCREQGQEMRKDLEQGLELMQAIGFIGEKSEGQIKEALENANIPVTDTNIANIVTALNMSQTALNMSDNAKVYILENDVEPTIENIYHGQYSGIGSADSKLYDTATWQQLLPQIENAVNTSGVVEEEAFENAKWLFANNLPVTADTIAKLDILNNISDDMTLDDVFKQIIQAMSTGSRAEEATLDTSEFVISQKYIQAFMSVTDGDIIEAVKLSDDNKFSLNLEILINAKAANREGNIPTVIYDIADETVIHQITAKRQIAEICLKMTMSSVNNMAAKGIDVATAPLEDIVNALREEENTYYKAQFADTGKIITDDEINLMREAVDKTADIAKAPAALIGSSVKQQSLLTLNELHGAAISQTYQRNLFKEVYEQVATEVNSAYGDSIDKAFEKIPDILSELGLEDTDANERAVRILGYNSMELTEENITYVKEYDTMLNRIIKNMKPEIVLNMIREGDNPLDTSIAELDETLVNIASSMDISNEEKYSKYLWQLEKTSSISENEKDGYIGIYRLLNSIEKTDGAAIGSVLNAGKSMTLSNLLTAVRTIKGKGINIEADKEFGGLEHTIGNSITEQINNGFSLSYAKAIVSDMLDEVTPTKLWQISDGNVENILNSSIEALAENIKKADDTEIEKEYYKEQAQELREIIDNSKAARIFLDSLGIDDSISNLNVAENMLQNGYSAVKEAYNRRNVLSEKEQEAYKEILEDMPEKLVDDETIKQQCEKAEKYMKKVLTNSYDVKHLNAQDLNSLKLLGQSIKLSAALTGRRSYEIPIIVGDKISTLNVTILSGYEDSGKVQISIDDTEEYGIGNISAELRIGKNDVKGLILCDNREGCEQIESNIKQLEAEMKSEGFNVKNISVCMDNLAGNEFLKGSIQNENADTAKLYAAAKIAVKYISNIIQSVDL